MARRRVSLAAHAPGALHPHLPAIKDDKGEIRPLGLIPQTNRALMKSLPRYRDTTDLIPESQWEEFDDWPEHIKIKDQNGFGACNGHAAAMAIETSRFVSGMDHVPISAWYTYAILCNGRDVGSSIGDALKLNESDGAAPESLVKYGTIDPRKLTPEAHAAAPRYKIELGASITTYEEYGTALQRRESLNVAVCVGANFNNLDGDGVAPLGVGPCNHAVCSALKMKRSKAGLWLAGIANSWTETWGAAGFFFEPIKKVVKGSYWEAYVVRAVVDDATSDTTRPPKGTA